MRSLMYCLIIFFMVSGTLTGTETRFSDIRSSHWAYKAVKELADMGLIKGFPLSGKFRGGKPLSRYEMAFLVKQVIDHLNSENQQILMTMTADTMQIVETLIKEYSDDIQAMNSKIEVLEKKTDRIDFKVGIVDSKINALSRENREDSEISRKLYRVQKENDRRTVGFLLAIAALAVKVF